MRPTTSSALLALAILASGCAMRSPFDSAQGDTGGALPYMQSGMALRALDETGAGKIEHVVYIVQENRSFDNLFQGYPGRRYRFER